MVSVVSTANPARKASRKRAVMRGSIGPLEDLESYVKADWWRDIFNANYLRTDGDVVEDPYLTKKEIDFFLRLLDIDKDTPTLDLCCGQGRHVLELARRGYTDLCGVDRSHYLISRAKRLAREQGLIVPFREGDARKLRFSDDKFGCVYLAGNSFGYFESADDDFAVLGEIRRILEPRGQLLIDFTDGDYLRENFDARSWEWIDKNHFVCRERVLSKDRSRLVSREVITHAKKGVIADQFYAERLYNIEKLGALLAECGFEVGESRPLSTMSHRNQDLGMMAQRIVLTARSNKVKSGSRPKKSAINRVAVILGDHRKKDTVKPGGTFDDDDYHTITELKKALSQLSGFRFTYFDNHDTLIDELRQKRGEVDYVFNLCDEGYNNDATHELHIPSLLEILGIPYSGGNPQCLAYCYDKSLVRGIANEVDIPVPKAFTIAPEEVTFISFPLEFPVIVKPNFGDSSVGITADSVCNDIGQLEQAVARVREWYGYACPVLVEEFLTGKDISVGIIGNPPDSYRVLPIIEEDYSALPEGLPRLCGYEAKWDTESEYFKRIKSISADLPVATQEFLHASCNKLFVRLGCQDYARFDWRLDANGTPRLLEVNPNPGWCWDGHLARMAGHADMSYGQMLESILKACAERYESVVSVNEAALVT